MHVDWSRRSYRQLARIVKGSDKKYWIRWYPCAEGAKPIPFLHSFMSPLWEDDYEEWEENGEGTGVFFKPREGRTNNYKAPPGTHYHGRREWFESGIPLDVLSGEVPPPPPDPECPPVTLTVRDVTGPSQVNATYDEVGVIDCDRSRGQAVEQVEQGRVRLYDIPTDTRPFIVHRIDGGGTQLVSLDAGHLYWANPGGGDVVYDISGVSGSSPGWWAWFVRQPAGGGTVRLYNGPLPGALSLNDTFLDHIDLAPGQAILLATMTVSSGEFRIMHVLANTVVGSSSLTLGTTPISGGSSGDVLSIDSGGHLARISGGVTGTFGG